MKNIRENMNKWFEKLDCRWKDLPIGKQHQYTLFLFVGYILLTVGVIFKVWYDMGKLDNNIVIEHIENPVTNKRNP